MIPTREDCHHLMEKYKVPIGVKKHCQAVNTLAVFLAKSLKASGVDIDVDLVDAASLLHDLVRVVNRNPNVPISHLPNPIARVLATILPMLPGPFVDVILKDSIGDSSRAKSTFGFKLTSVRSIW